MLKKLFSLVLVLVLVMGLSLVSTASAAERYGSSATPTPAPSGKVVTIMGAQYTLTESYICDANGVIYGWEEVPFAIGEYGRIAARKPNESLKKGIPAANTVGTPEVLSDGQIIRYKYLIPGTLDEAGFFANGATRITVAWIPHNTALLNNIAVKDALTAVDKTSIYFEDNSTICHRGVGSAKESELVGFLIFEDGAFAKVYYTNYEDSMQLCFDLGAVSKKANPGNPTPPSTGDESKGDADFTISGEENGNTGNNQTGNTDFTISGEQNGGNQNGENTNTGNTGNGGWSDELTDGSEGNTNTGNGNGGWSDELTDGSEGNTNTGNGDAGFTISEEEAPKDGWTI